MTTCPSHWRRVTSTRHICVVVIVVVIEVIVGIRSRRRADVVIVVIWRVNVDTRHQMLSRQRIGGMAVESSRAVSLGQIVATV